VKFYVNTDQIEVEILTADSEDGFKHAKELVKQVKNLVPDELLKEIQETQVPTLDPGAY